MPIYEYRCKACGKRFEKLVRGSEKVKCPCGSADVAKLFSTFGVKSSGKFTPSSGGSSCGSCAASSCEGCGK